MTGIGIRVEDTGEKDGDDCEEETGGEEGFAVEGEGERDEGVRPVCWVEVTGGGPLTVGEGTSPDADGYGVDMTVPVGWAVAGLDIVISDDGLEFGLWYVDGVLDSSDPEVNTDGDIDGDFEGTSVDDDGYGVDVTLLVGCLDAVVGVGSSGDDDGTSPYADGYGVNVTVLVGC